MIGGYGQSGDLVALADAVVQHLDLLRKDLE